MFQYTLRPGLKFKCPRCAVIVLGDERQRWGVVQTACTCGWFKQGNWQDMGEQVDAFTVEPKPSNIGAPTSVAEDAKLTKADVVEAYQISDAELDLVIAAEQERIKEAAKPSKK